ncbi:hypothetical protein IQ278_04385 [Tolypothrix sp. LEGE 11397]|nr:MULTISPECIES: hypothetical protein [unclassified Tolypothrix]BAY94706.1 hypothetical protein NIES3275_67580 [Microchaete diplosiphon NIES-3275]EKE99061.1 hypothetical protein FDUTEX481_03253 [Tolypothrix sp. PCC 7601]MBE9081382.1 hypothetical protein [Tolypothrix sp. LEGE 11397]UYD28399.1 hypothetical protein HGR01_10355 [Tolypothrix sp. PCC 7712]UYD35723.1 hypothetical protein HG267_08210 [Tolypothrix sp. PCC 7601]
MSYASKICQHIGKILLLITLMSLPLPALSENKQLNNEPQTLQTEISDRDLKIIEQLVAIAQRQSSQVGEAKAAMGWGAFTDILSVEFSPSQSTTNYNLPEILSESERSFGIALTFDPIKLLNIIQELPLREARWQEAKQQKRLAVLQSYLAYLQAQQAKKIAAYKMQQLAVAEAKTERIASVNPQVTVPHQISLANPDYVAAATEMLNTNARERLALEELAACVGLSSQATMTILTKAAFTFHEK